MPQPVSEPRHPLWAVLRGAIAGRFPRVDGGVEVMPCDGPTWAVVEFSGHSVVLGAVTVDEIRAHGADGLGGSSRPHFVSWLADRAEATAGTPHEIGSHDVVLVGTGTGATTASDTSLPDGDLHVHPRVQRAHAHRSAVVVDGDRRGLFTIGTGFVGRRELSVELFDGVTPGRRAGRRLVERAVGLIAAGEPVFAQVAAGNTASLRMFLAVGFTPIAAEILVTPAVDTGDADRAVGTDHRGDR